MSFPLVLCTGILRSGSTWSFNVCRMIARIAADRDGRLMGATFLSEPQSEEFFQLHAARPPGYTVIKAHVLGPRGVGMLRAGGARAICTYRDPRDCVASMMTFASQPFDDAVESISNALVLLELYTRCGNTLFIRYEDMIKDSRTQVALIAHYLGVALEPGILDLIDRQCGIEQSKRACAEVLKKPLDQVYRSMDHVVDPVTWLHNNHIYSGKPGRWREEMSEEQIQIMHDRYAVWLKRLGYATSEPMPA